MSHSPKSPPNNYDLHQTVQSDVVSEPQNPQFETLIPKSDPETLDPDHEFEDGGDEDFEFEFEEDMSEPQLVSSGTNFSVSVPPITDPHVSNSGTPKSRKKKGKGNKKPNVKKQLAIEEKLKSLVVNLRPVLFSPVKSSVDFTKHESLLRRLGLWDFVHIEFDKEVRVDLVAQLVASYEAKARCGYVNGCRVMVNRADLARAFKFPVKREKGNVEEGGVVDLEVLSDESIGVVVEIVSEWVLLHGDMWMMPNEVINWMKLVREGHPEKVDWAGMVWFMVEKELTKGAQLTECYYASHLQYLIKSQRGELFLKEETGNEVVEVVQVVEGGVDVGDGIGKVGDGSVDVGDGIGKVGDGSVNVGDEIGKVGEGGVAVGDEIDKFVEGDLNVGNGIEETGDERGFVVGPSTKLTLGQDDEKEEEMKEEEEEMMDVENCNENDEDRVDDEQGHWFLQGKNDMGEHFMQPCSVEHDGGFGSFEERKEGEIEDEDEDEIDIFPNGDGLGGEGVTTGNLLQGMEDNHIGFTSHDEDIIGADMLPPSSSFFNHMGKRVMDHDDDISHHAQHNGSRNKRLRMNDMWDHHKQDDYVTLIDQIQQMTERARMLYEEKENACAEANNTQQMLLEELQKRDAVIEQLHKARMEDNEKKNFEIYRLEREVQLLVNVLDGYRKALKSTQKSYSEYRERARLQEESTYVDAGPGGLMMSRSDLEKLRQKQEEEFKMNCLIVEEKVKEVEAGYAAQFNGFFEKINDLEKKLTGVEAEGNELIKMYAERKNSRVEEKVAEVAEPQLIKQTEEGDEEMAKVAEVAEPQLIEQTEEGDEEMAEVAEEPLKVPETEETMVEAEEPQVIPETEENVPEDVAEPPGSE